MSIALSIAVTGFVLGFWNFSEKKTVMSKQNCCGATTLRRMVGTYYTTQDGFQSTLILNNKGPNQIMVTPILHSQNGETFTAAPVPVGGQSSSEVDLNLLASTAGRSYASGSFEFTYTGRLLEMGGGLRIVNAQKSLIFDEQTLEPGMKFGDSRLEAVYAIPFGGSRVQVMITNTTSKTIVVEGSATFLSDDEKERIWRRLDAYESKIIVLPRGWLRRESAGAVSLTHNGEKGALLAMIHLQDEDRGYSETVNFTNPVGKTNEKHGAGFRLGNISGDQLRPVIAVRNLGDVSTTVNASIPYSKQNGDKGAIELPQVSLAPGEIKLLNTTGRRLGRYDFATAGLEIKYTGEPGSVIVSASSVSRRGDHVFSLPMKDPQGGVSSTGGYPWFINESGSTVVFIKNTSDKEQTFRADVIYDGGIWGSNLRTLAPHETYLLDIKAIRDAQVKGPEKNTIPVDAQKGHIFWTIFGTNEKALIGRAQTVSLADGMASTYECQSCACSIETVSFATGYYDGRVIAAGEDDEEPGGTVDFNAQQQDVNCYGGPGGWFDRVPDSWETANSNIATVDIFGNVTAQDQVGTVAITAHWDAYNYQYDQVQEYCHQLSRNGSGILSFTTRAPVPHHVRVISDVSYAHQDSATPAQNCVAGREITVQVVNRKNRNITTGSVQEAFANLVNNTCPNSVNPTPSACDVLGNQQNTSAGQFRDGMAVRVPLCGSTTIVPSGGCGYTLTSTWSMCNGSTTAIWTYDGETKSNGVKVNGSFGSFIPGKQLCPAGVTCPAN